MNLLEKLSEARVSIFGSVCAIIWFVAGMLRLTVGVVYSNPRELYILFPLYMVGTFAMIMYAYYDEKSRDAILKLEAVQKRINN